MQEEKATEEQEKTGRRRQNALEKKKITGMKTWMNGRMKDKKDRKEGMIEKDQQRKVARKSRGTLGMKRTQD